AVMRTRRTAAAHPLPRGEETLRRIAAAEHLAHQSRLLVPEGRAGGGHRSPDSVRAAVVQNPDFVRMRRDQETRPAAAVAAPETPASFRRSSPHSWLVAVGYPLPPGGILPFHRPFD